MSGTETILLILAIFAVFTGLDFCLGFLMNGWVLLAMTVGLGVAGHLLSNALARAYGGGGWSSLGASIVFFGYVLPGVAGFGLRALIGRVLKGSE